MKTINFASSVGLSMTISHPNLERPIICKHSPVHTVREPNCRFGRASTFRGSRSERRVVASLLPFPPRTAAELSYCGVGGRPFLYVAFTRSPRAPDQPVGSASERWRAYPLSDWTLPSPGQHNHQHCGSLCGLIACLEHDITNLVFQGGAIVTFMLNGRKIVRDERDRNDIAALLLWPRCPTPQNTVLSLPQRSVSPFPYFSSLKAICLIVMGEGKRWKWTVLSHLLVLLLNSFPVKEEWLCTAGRAWC